MQLILADTLVAPRGLARDITVDKRCIYQSLLAYNQDLDLDDKELVKKKLVNEIISTEDDSIGSLLIKVTRPISTSNAGPRYEVTVTPSVPDKSIFKFLVQKFRQNVKISLNFYKKYNTAPTIDYASTKGMTIDCETFTCVGNISTAIWIGLPTIFVKIVADINIEVSSPITIPKGDSRSSFAKQVLEKEHFSDLIISAGNGAEIKAHKAFFSICSPVLEAMLKSGMEETQTGRVDMSDLSEEGVRAFLRYVYFEDLEEPKTNIQVAFELLYAGHKYNVSRLEADMTTVLLNWKSAMIGKEFAFKIYMFTRNIEAALELKTKALQILMCEQLDQLYANKNCGESSFEAEIDSFLTAANDENIDVAVAFKMYVLARDIESAAELKNTAFQVLKAKWHEVESLQEYNDLFMKPSNSLIVRDLCRDLALALMAASK